MNTAYKRFLKLGALGAKMSGAGFRGTTFGLFPSQTLAKEVEAALRAKDVPCWQISIPATS
jgi:mevalonate kinase